MGGNFPHIFPEDLEQPVMDLPKGLAELNDIDVTFVVPKAFGDEEHSVITINWCKSSSNYQKKKFSLKIFSKKLIIIEVESQFVPYVGEEEFWNLKSGKYSKETRFVETDEGFKIDFPEHYGPDCCRK